MDLLLLTHYNFGICHQSLLFRKDALELKIVKHLGVLIQYRKKKSFWNTLNFGLRSLNLKIPPSDNLLPYSLKNKSECISDLKVICAQSCGYIEALWALRSAKTGS